MQYFTNVESWVVYEMTINGQTSGRRAICEQQEWNAMKLANPEQHILIQDRMPSEGEAERLARGTSGDPKARNKATPIAVK